MYYYCWLLSSWQLWLSPSLQLWSSPWSSLSACLPSHGCVGFILHDTPIVAISFCIWWQYAAMVADCCYCGSCNRLTPITSWSTNNPHMGCRSMLCWMGKTHWITSKPFIQGMHYCIGCNSVGKQLFPSIALMHRLQMVWLLEQSLLLLLLLDQQPQELPSFLGCMYVEGHIHPNCMIWIENGIQQPWAMLAVRNCEWQPPPPSIAISNVELLSGTIRSYYLIGMIMMDVSVQGGIVSCSPVPYFFRIRNKKASLLYSGIIFPLPPSLYT